MMAPNPFSLLYCSSCHRGKHRIVYSSSASKLMELPNLAYSCVFRSLMMVLTFVLSASMDSMSFFTLLLASSSFSFASSMLKCTKTSPTTKGIGADSSSTRSRSSDASSKF
uniref:Uncharacterized protein n=1 Tax=Daphnia magna TaxID=35525 RepID=A0A0P5XMX6_9CRUS